MKDNNKPSFADLNRSNNLLPKEERFPKTGDIAQQSFYACMECGETVYCAPGEVLPPCPSCQKKSFYLSL